MPSFDTVSELDSHELTNAVDQANRELSQRFDFKDSGASYELKEKEFTVSLKAPAEFQLKQMIDILTQRLSKRGIDVRCMEKKDPVSNLAEARQDIHLRHGVDQDTGKSRRSSSRKPSSRCRRRSRASSCASPASSVMTCRQRWRLLRKTEVDRPLQFKNFRD